MTSPAAITYGPILIGTVFNIMLYGIMITQTFLYFTVYKQDKLWMKLFVCLLFLCDTLNSVFDIVFVYVPLVNKFGDPGALSYATWVFATDPAMTAIIALQVQLFFAWRVKVLTGSIPAVVLIVICSLFQFFGGLGTAIAVGMIPEFVQFQRFKAIVIVWLAFSSIADVAITFALVWHLRKHKTGFAATDDIVNRVIRMTVQTGLVTALWASIDLVAYLTSSSGLHLIFNIPLAKLYTNSLMSSLNSRAGWRYSNTQSAVVVESRRSDIAKDRFSTVGGSQGQAANHYSVQSHQIHVDVESHSVVDPV
ncbi:hypothetical protein OBBRIDRAFT_759000 [Obba rivulosa]|uniref:DUF6534 domain-containing protein n=1 Tax=Obba rivulosa TaxID=1052685 RepID=A0A8E2DHA9_9APHY|nr:hypothetical protein OBBRIDRAFT_759000 [Obba rivulosa]